MSGRSETRILEGRTWDDFCDRLREAGKVVMHGPANPFDRAEGFRYLSRITRAALQTFVEHADPLAPVLQRVVHETAKMGADNPDNFYFNAAIRGTERYRVYGNRGSVHYLSFSTMVGHYGQGAAMPPSGSLDASQMTIADDGSFEIILSVDEPEGAANWLPMKPESGTLIVRQTRLDPAAETLADIHIEPVGGVGETTPVTAKTIDEGLTQSGNLVYFAAAMFASWANGFEAHANELPEFDRDRAKMAGGDPNIVYYHSYWKLGPDEALVIDATPPPCDHWNFQLNNHWMESLDYRYFRIHVNSKTAAYRDDGSVRIVVAHEDPGVPNWIQTVGHERGTMCFRWVRAEEHPQPRTRVVPLRDVAALD
ncbi:MAG: DUF1214 domain-containing protein [Sandaracinaceae bacterium]|nr:DUF1214 domain-containing protein [Sandaracinaceae bacterium]